MQCRGGSQWFCAYCILLLILALMCKLTVTEQAFGSSPSFSVKEITDKRSNWIDINNTHHNGDPSTDILKVNYLSDGTPSNITSAQPRSIQPTAPQNPNNAPPIIQTANEYTFITKWGSNGTGNGQFRYPNNIAVDSSGNVYVADSFNSRVQKFDSNGAFITKWGSNGPDDGQFSNPYGVAVDSSGNVYVADEVNSRIQVFAPSSSTNH